MNQGRKEGSKFMSTIYRPIHGIGIHTLPTHKSENPVRLCSSKSISARGDEVREGGGGKELVAGGVPWSGRMTRRVARNRVREGEGRRDCSSGGAAAADSHPAIAGASELGFGLRRFRAPRSAPRKPLRRERNM